MLHAVQMVADREYEESSKAGYVIQRIARTILFLHNYLLTLYSYYFPYDLLTPDEQVNALSRNRDWTNGIVRAMKWHPTAGKCAVALTNDDVLIYSTPDAVVPLLRHPMQKKVVELAWKPGVKECNVIAIGCQSLVVVWKIELEATGRARVPVTHARLVEKNFAVPITSVSYDLSGDWLLVCSPKTTKILLINEKSEKPVDPKIPANHFLPVAKVMDSSDKQKDEKAVKEDKVIREWYDLHGFFRLIWSPDRKRLVSCSTSNSIRIWESVNWTSEKFGAEFLTDVCQACVWSKPYGRYLLVAPRNEAAVYAIPFYEAALVGASLGRRSYQKILDVSEYELPNGQMVGGAVHDMAWDQHSQRLVISFRDNPEFLAAFRTQTRSILEVEPLGLIHGLPGEKPLLMDFHDAFKKGSVLTICWSSGFLSHVPFQYDVVPAPTAGDRKRVASVTTSTPRSLTSFCRSPMLMSSPQASPIPNQGQLMTRSYTSFMSDDPTLSFASPSSHHHLLSSDSVMSPRRPVLFSTMTAAAGGGKQHAE